MNSSQTLYFVGWDYMSPVSVMLKRALRHPANPWQPRAIVHDQIWVPAVDDIPLMTTSHFLQQQDLTNSRVMLFIKDSHHRDLWLRRVRQHGLQLIDEGEFFTAFNAALLQSGQSANLGIMTLPDALDSSLLPQLQAYAPHWATPHARQVFSAYLQFLDSGLSSGLRKHMQTSGNHPMHKTRQPGVAEAMRELGHGLVWDIGQVRSPLLEQACLLQGLTDWHYAFSGNDASTVSRAMRQLQLLLSPLGIHPASAVLVQAGESLQLLPVAGHTLPNLDGRPILAHIDLPQPLPVIDYITRHSQQYVLTVRLGHRPADLLGILHRFPQERLSLSCDRPGPLGLNIRIR